MKHIKYAIAKYYITLLDSEMSTVVLILISQEAAKIFPEI